MKLFDIKKYSRIFMALTFTATACFTGAVMQSCTDESMSDDNKGITPVNPNATFYISLKVNTPIDRTRATTDNKEDLDSSEGELDATAEEKALYSAMLYFCDEQYNYITSFEINGIPDSSTGQYELKKEVKSEELVGLAGKKVYLFVVGNYSFAPVHNMGRSVKADNAIISISDIDAVPVGDFRADGVDGRLMTLVNRHPYLVDFTEIKGQGDELLDAISHLFWDSPNSTYKLEDCSDNNYKVIDLERAVARIDWKDLPRETGNGTDNKYLPANTYHLGDSEVLLQTYSMQLLNVNKKSYLFRHTAAGTNLRATGEGTLFGREKMNTGGNDYRWFAGNDWGDDATKTCDFWNELDSSVEPYGITTATGHEGTILISELSKRTTQDGYYPWRYVTENTLPSVDLMSDENLLENATGIAFTFQIMTKASDGSVVALTKDNMQLAPDCIEFAYPETLKPQEGVVGDVPGPNYAINVTMPDMFWMEVPWTKTGEIVDEATGEETEVGGYFLTYYAFIKHNNATDTVVEGEAADGEEAEPVSYPAPMKYGVVRNNVYQLHVTHIDRLPFPKEPRTVFLELDVQVQEWLIRQNEWSF